MINDLKIKQYIKDMFPHFTVNVVSEKKSWGDREVGITIGGMLNGEMLAFSAPLVIEPGDKNDTIIARVLVVAMQLERALYEYLVTQESQLRIDYKKYHDKYYTVDSEESAKHAN